MPRLTRLRHRGFELVCALLVALGVGLFMWGGSRHPGAGAELGALGNAGYFAALAALVEDHPDWGRIHGALLAGPVLWALGTAGLLTRVHERAGARYGLLGRAALLVGATLWAVAFVFAAFAVPVHSAAVVDSGDATREIAIANLRATQTVAFRLGLVGLLALGLGMASISAAVIAGGMRSTMLRWAVGATGALLGIWPSVAWLAGIFQPSPFTSPLWDATAALTAAWFLALAIALSLSAGEPRTAAGPRATRGN